MEIAQYTTAQCKAIYKALIHCDSLTEAEQILNGCSGCPIFTKIQIWGLFDGWDHRESSVGGFITDRTPEKDAVILEKLYTEAYDLGGRLRTERR